MEYRRKEIIGDCVLYLGDCRRVMNLIPEDYVDAVITDPPYGVTGCKWDTVIPLPQLWEQINRINKKNGVFVFTASQPFTTILISSNIKNFKYCWIWEKDQGVNFQLAKKMPLKIHEDIPVFYRKPPLYVPQGTIPCNIKKSNKRRSGTLYKEHKRKDYIQTQKNYPTSILKFNKSRGLHSTQKPVKLFEYLINTYTREEETVFDFSFGSGTTGIACQNLNRKFIGIEIEEKYFEIACKRMEQNLKEKK